MFDFDKYNVIVGANNSGKTNLIRVLDMISNNDDFTNFIMHKNLKFEKTKPSEIFLTLKFTDEEIKMILQSMFGHQINQTEFSDEVKTMDVLIFWSDVIKDAPYPNLVFYKLHNGLTIVSAENQNMVFDSSYLFGNEDRYQKAIDSHKHFAWGSFLNKFTKNYTIREDNTIGNQPKFFEACARNESMGSFFQKDRNLYTTIRFSVEFNQSNPTVEGSEVADFLSLKKDSTHRINLSRLVNNIIKMNYVKIQEIHPTYKQLTDRLAELRNVYPADYEELQDVFEELTNGIKITVVRRTPQNEISKEEWVLLKDGERVFSLQESASGHYGLIYILHSILNKPNQMIIIDEPEVHFHPIMITQLNESLNKLALERNNQIVIISHSPKFVNFNLIDSVQYSKLISVIRTKDFSEVSSSSASFQPALKRHLFNPEVFFGKCSMIVEGSDDYFAMKAISDYHNGLFEKYNITLTHCWGLGNVPAMIEIHNEFKIPFLAMVDSDYTSSMDDVVKLPQRLEEEYQKLGWSGSKVKDNAYPFMEELLKNGGLNKLKRTTLWSVFKQIITKVDGEIPKITS